MTTLSKRDFLKSTVGLGFADWTQWTNHLTEQLSTQLSRVAHLSAEQLAQDEDFWLTIRKKYSLKPDYINLENGYYSMAAQPVLEGFVKHVRDINREASYYMRTRQFDDKLTMRTQLAQLLGCATEELIVTRNTTESLDTVIAGYDWKPGDEAVMAEQDYGAMLDMFKLQARRYGIVNRVISLPNHPSSDEQIVALYRQAITPRTRLLMVCHMVNITGQILPVRQIADMAHEQGVDVLVDGAHALAHVQFDIKDLHADYYGSSLHKWLGCPLGAGILYVKRENIRKIWPMFGESGFADDDIRKLNHTGTHPVHTDLAIADAIAFHKMIGIERKEARLRYLQQYWTSRVRNLPNVQVNTPADPQRACGIANVGISHLKPGELAKTLLERYKVWTVAIDYAQVHGVRITPHLYTTTAELDRFVEAIRQLAKQKG
jgi:selenocysteine lyase/cysteine desulfurase